MSATLVFEISPLFQPGKGTLVILMGDSGQVPRPVAEIVGENLVKSLIKNREFKGERFKHIESYLTDENNFDRLILLGIGDLKKFNSDDWLKMGGVCRSVIADSSYATVIVELEGEALSESEMADFICGLELRHYRFDKYIKCKEHGKKSNLKIVLQTGNIQEAQHALGRAQKLASAVIWTRDLVNEPANMLGTEEFVARIQELKEVGIEIDILDENDLERIGFSALLAVARGSRRPPRLVIMRWNGSQEGERPVAFIGKGVVFDAGGLSIKPSSGMKDMKGDMAGGAAVAGAMRILANRKSRANVVGVVGLVENMPGGDAMRPGDIITSISGQSIEITNTDAEGRLVLADTLWFTREKFNPLLMIDLATLTGAITVALGQQYAGLFSNNDVLADKLYAVGNLTGERLWRMPLCEDYDKIVDSKVADMRNSTGRLAGSITAAQFLNRFIGNTPWAHLDIAGTAIGVPKNKYNESWASGFGVRLLDRLIADYHES